MYHRRNLPPLVTSLLIVGGLAPLAASAQSSWYVGASLGQSAIYLPIHRQMLTWASRANVRPVIAPSNNVNVRWIVID